MNFNHRSREAFSGAAAAAAVFVADQYLTLNQLDLTPYFFKFVLLVTFITATVFGPRMPLSLKTWSTGIFLIWGLYGSIGGRTVNVHITAETITWSIFTFAFMSLPLLLPLYRLWGRSLKSTIATAFPIVTLLLGILIGTIEEKIFILHHENGVGPTPRWLVNSHWIAYEKGKLRGGD